MRLLIMLFISLCLTRCSPPVNITGSWKTPEEIPTSNRTVFIISVSGDEKIRKIVESNLAAEAARKNYKAFKSSEHMINGTRNLDSVFDKAIELNCDMIFSAALLDRKKEKYYVKGTVASYGPNAGFGYGGFGSTVYTPGYYQEDEVYFFESNLYDTRSKKVVWSSQSESAVLKDLNSFSKKYAKAMVKQLETDKILKK
jgi:hypothetical protein